MNINRIDPSHQSERKPYLELPFRLAGEDPLPFPALRSSTAFDLSQAHPFHQHSEAAFFTAGSPARPAGRLAVLENRNFNAFHQTRQAFFTHFECTNDPTAAQALFGAARQWAQRRGLDRLVGPIGLLQTDARGMMISGHGKLASFALPYSPPYHAQLMDEVGFSKRHDYLSGELPHNFRIAKRVEELAERMLERSGLSLHRGTCRSTLRKMGSRLLEVYKETGAAAPLYYPLTPAEEQRILEQLVQTAQPRLIHWLEKKGKICGIHMALPNYMEALRRGGKNRIVRTAAFLRQRARPREINITTAYLRPEHQHRGLILVLTAACQQAALERGARSGLLGPIAESNRAMLSVMRKTGVEFNIRHRVFEQEIT